MVSDAHRPVAPAHVVQIPYSGFYREVGSDWLEVVMTTDNALRLYQQLKDGLGLT